MKHLYLSLMTHCQEGSEPLSSLEWVGLQTNICPFNQLNGNNQDNEYNRGGTKLSKVFLTYGLLLTPTVCFKAWLMELSSKHLLSVKR